MRNMKIKTKLMVSFIVVLALAAIVGLLGILGMYRINEADDAMYTGNYLPTVLANEISQNIVEQRVMFRNFIIFDVEEDAERFQANVKDLTDSKKEMEGLFADYDITIANDEDRAAFTEFVKAYNDEWMSFADLIQSLGTDNKMQEAKTALIEIGAPAAAKMDDLCDTLQDINMSDGKKAVDGNTDLFNTMTFLEIAALVLAVAGAMFFAFYISGLISKPMLRLKSVMDQMGNTGSLVFSDEDKNVLIKAATGKDEIAQSIAATVKTIQHFENASIVLEQVASGDLTAEFAVLSDKDTMGNSLKKMIDNLNAMFSEINASTGQVSTGAKQIADGAQSLAQGSTEQAAAVEQLSSSIAEIAEKTKENAAMAGKAATLANSIMGNAEKGSRQMGEMMGAVKEINEASQSINKVIKVIDDIAFQTNILALNAAVEAARAGQHGKGFAVVAEEVRNLAAKSAEAAKDTGSLIANSMEKAELGARIADETSSSLHEIVSGINESTQLVSDIAKSSEEQSEGISQVNKGIDQVAQVVQQNSATAQQSAAASEEMSGQSDMLQSLVAQFKTKDADSSFSMLSAPPSSGAAKRLANPRRNTYSPSSTQDDFGKY